MTEAEKDLETLKKRAVALAAPEGAQDAGDRAEFLEFRLAGERYAVELALVREVCAGRELTRIPGAPPFIAGVANIRGQILPVADLALFFGIRAEAPERRELVILRARAAGPAREAGGAGELAVLADAVLGVSSLAPEEIQPPPPGFTGIYGQYLGGIAARDTIIFLADRFLESTAAGAN